MRIDGKRPRRPIARAASIAVPMLLAAPVPVTAGENGLAGQYICQSGCRVTDALPGIDIERQGADCMNELGGVYKGQVLTDRSVACFNMVGTLSNNGESIVWSNGNVWRRWRPRVVPKPAAHP